MYLALVLDTHSNGAQLNSEDVFTVAAAKKKLWINAFRDMTQVERYKVLWAKRFHEEHPPITYDGTNIEIGASSVPFEIYVNLKGLPVSFKANGGTIADIVDNSLHLIAIPAFSTIQHPTIMYQARLRFRG